MAFCSAIRRLRSSHLLAPCPLPLSSNCTCFFLRVCVCLALRFMSRWFAEWVGACHDRSWLAGLWACCSVTALGGLLRVGFELRAFTLPGWEAASSADGGGDIRKGSSVSLTFPSQPRYAAASLGLL
jgi:hypothetical protein